MEQTKKTINGFGEKTFDTITLSDGRKVKVRTIIDPSGNESMVASESTEQMFEEGGCDDELFYCYIEDDVFYNYTDEELQRYFEENFD